MNKQLLESLFDYKDGHLYWKIKPADHINEGTKAGFLCKDGYLMVRYKKKSYMLHRLIWVFHGKELPKSLDHIDGNKQNNRIENLRVATFSQNSHNTKKRITNTSGHKNVTWNKQAKKWQVGLKIQGKFINIGCYKDLELAGLVAKEARIKYHGEYARHE